MKETAIHKYRELAECMGLDGDYEVVSYIDNPKTEQKIRIVHAFGLPKHRAEAWARCLNAKAELSRRVKK